MGLIQWYKDNLLPWKCVNPACGKKHISAAKTECPKCFTPKPGSAGELTGEIFKTYTGQAELRRGIEKMAKRGWVMKSQVALAHTFGAGPFAQALVTFERVEHRQQREQAENTH